MKFFEMHFEEYINSNKKQNLHPKLSKIFEKFPANMRDLKNLIFYGPSGVGKYTQMLTSIKKYSPSELKYEKKINAMHNKQMYNFKLSDIHYEVDMSLLGCNSKLLWHDIYLQIVDIISAKNDKSGIIVCKNFHEIHNELLENFYSYMQQNTLSIDIKFILMTEEISFISDNILNCCEIINISRPSKTHQQSCLKHKNINYKLNSVLNITNIKNIYCGISENMPAYKIICDKILNNMLNLEELKYLKFRDILYDVFIYNLDITDCILYIISELIHKNKLTNNDLSKILIKTFTFLQYYNNNYRPIYHLESYLLYLTSIINGYSNSC